MAREVLLCGRLYGVYREALDTRVQRSRKDLLGYIDAPEIYEAAGG